jgi:ABC-type antimicrobial peptide transport system permease subunit
MLTDGAFFTDKDTNVLLANQNLAQQFYVSNPRRWEPAPADFNLMNEKVTVSVDMLYGEKLQSGQTPAKIPAKPVKMRVSGSLGISGSQYDYTIFMPLEQVKKLKADQDKFNKSNGLPDSGGGMVYSKVGGVTTPKGYTQAVVKVKDMDAVSKVFEDIKALGYEAYSPIQMIDEMKKQSAGLRQILGGIGAMALLIAAIGITNTMYMSIYERTREIGIIKVIGARLADIRRLFMVEAAWIGIFGGITGVIFSWAASLFLNNSNINIMGGNQMWGPDGVTRLPISYIPLWLMAAAFGFAIAAALIAGFFPARRAMRLSVMKALVQD